MVLLAVIFPQKCRKSSGKCGKCASAIDFFMKKRYNYPNNYILNIQGDILCLN